MLRKCTEEEFRQYIDFAYGLALDLTKSGYPTYCDGVKTKEMFIERSLKAFSRDDEQMLLFEMDGKVEGLILCYWIPEDHYLDTSFFLINRETGQAVSEFLSYARENFPGYDLFLGFPADNRAAVESLTALGFECIEDDYNNTAFIDRIGPVPEDIDVVRIDKDNYQSFQCLHEQIEGGMYWNSERIFEDMDNWIIFVKEKDGKPRGAVYIKDEDDGWFEIFGIDIDGNAHDREVLKELLQAAVAEVKRRNGRILTFFCEEEYEDVVRECGITCIGRYLCYKTHLE